MGSEPDRVEEIYCRSCGRDTMHNIYIQTRNELKQNVVYGELFQYTETSGAIKHTTYKQVCTVCGKTKIETISRDDDTCQIV